MAGELDVRGLSCPVPVMRARERMLQLGRGSLEVRVDTDTARENVNRQAEHLGWSVEVKEDGAGYRLLLHKD